MRRLLALLIALSALFGVQPCAAAPARHASAMTDMPCHQDRAVDPGTHACLGCAVRPDDVSRVAGPVQIAAIAPAAAPEVRAVDHTTGFDPPPPRAVG